MSSAILRDEALRLPPSRDSLQDARLNAPVRLANGVATHDPEVATTLDDHLLVAISPAQAEALGESKLRVELQQIIDEWTRADPDSVDFHERERALNSAVDTLIGYGPIGGLLRETDISEILINGPRQIFIERRGQLAKSDVVFRNEEQLLTVIRRLIAVNGPTSR